MINDEPIDSEIVLDGAGRPVGPVLEVYRNDVTQHLAWVAVSTPAGPRFVPLRTATRSPEAITVPFSTEQIVAAPVYDPEAGQLRVQDEAVLYEHYGLDHALPFDQGLSGTAVDSAGTATGAVL